MCVCVIWVYSIDMNLFICCRSAELTSFVASTDCLTAEVLWVMNSICCHYSYKSQEATSQLFSRIFPDSAIARKFSCGECKTAYLACFGLAPFIESSLCDSVKSVNQYVLMFDESLNKATQKKQLDIHLRFWDSHQEQVTTRYLTSQFMGHASAEDLLNTVSSAIREKNLDLLKILQISMDGPNVNWSFYSKISEELAESDPDAKEFLNVGSCGLHVVHNAFKTGAKASEMGVEDLLSGLYWLFSDSPARRDDFQVITGTSTFPLKFCRHRWLENVPVSVRAQDIKYVKTVQKDKQYCEPTSKSYQTVKKIVNTDPLICLKMAFFESVAKQLQPFLVLFQSDSPLLPFMSTHLQKMITALMKRFIKSDLVERANTVSRLLRLDVLDKKNIVDREKIDVGFVVKNLIKTMKREKKISDLQVMEFLLQSLAFLQKTTKKLMEKTPISYTFARDVTCLDPSVFLNDTAKTRFRSVLSKLVETKHIKARDCDRLIWKFDEFQEKAKLETTCSEFKPQENRLDCMIFKLIGKDPEYEALWEVFKLLLILSHGQASVERGFSVNRQIMVENMKEHSFIGQRLIQDYSPCWGYQGS